MTASSGRMTAAEFALIRAYVEEHSGIRLTDTKDYLVETRLRPISTARGCATFADLLVQAQRDRSGDLRAAIVEAITTNETTWFRDEHPFECFARTLLPDVRTRLGSRRVPRIWSAASSTGQEAYSVAMILRELAASAIGPPSQVPEILATDISPTVLQKAEAATYDGFAMSRGLSRERRDRFFVSADGARWKLKDEVRALVRFKLHNLKHSTERHGRFDIIFLRNVLIYFSENLRREVVDRMANALVPDGYLIVGAAEDIANYSDLLIRKRFDRTIVHQRASDTLF